MSHYPPLKFESTMPFGKYKGTAIAEIADKDPEYILWLVNNTDARVEDEVLEYVNKS